MGEGEWWHDHFIHLIIIDSRITHKLIYIERMNGIYTQKALHQVKESNSFIKLWQVQSTRHNITFTCTHSQDHETITTAYKKTTTTHKVNANAIACIKSDTMTLIWHSLHFVYLYTCDYKRFHYYYYHHHKLYGV